MKRISSLSLLAAAALALTACGGGDPEAGSSPAPADNGSAEQSTGTDYPTPESNQGEGAPAEPPIIGYQGHPLEVLDGNSLKMRVDFELRSDQPDQNPNSKTMIKKELEEPYELIISDYNFSVPEGDQCGADKAAAQFQANLKMDNNPKRQIRAYMPNLWNLDTEEMVRSIPSTDTAGRPLLDIRPTRTTWAHTWMLKDGYASYGEYLPSPEEVDELYRSTYTQLEKDVETAQERDYGIWADCPDG